MQINDQSREIDSTLESVVSKIQKLLNVAAKAGTPEEAAAFTEKAMAMLEAHNLDMGSVERANGQDMKREEQKAAAGMYEWQRDLWHAVARLNFCLSFHTRSWRRKINPRTGAEFGKLRLRNNMHVVGKTVNVRLTISMVEYLTTAIERAVEARYPKNERDWYGDEIMTYRDGMAAKVYNRLLDRRDSILAQERERAEKEAMAAGPSSGTALTLTSLTQSEEDANNDFLHGEGWSAKRRQEREDRARARREAEEAYTKWAAENPEEAAAERKKREEEEKKYAEGRRKSGGPGSRGGRGYSLTAAEKRREANYGDYARGYAAGDKISLDVQINKAPDQKLLR